MIRVNSETPLEVLRDVKIGNLITDTHSKTGLVEGIEIEDEGYYMIFKYHLVTGRTILVKKK